MKVTIIGTGYVGLVTGACLAEVGNKVLCLDLDKEKISRLSDGIIPIYEPGLEEMVKRNITRGRLKFTSDIEESVNFADMQMIAVGTPPGTNGDADLQYVLAAAQNVGRYMKNKKLVVNKSTVPVGTGCLVKTAIQNELKARNVQLDVTVVSNPEFLKEGAAIDDFMKPDRIIIGADDPSAFETMNALYGPFQKNHDKIIFMDLRSAELSKYAANAMLATRISFMNELARVAEEFGADIELVRKGIGSDPRIGYQFLYPGVGYGGSCFPKDVKALISMGHSKKLDLKVLNAVEDVNRSQREFFANKVLKRFNGNLKGLKLALWGLSFKPNTDDMREAPSLDIIKYLESKGATFNAYDPIASEAAKGIVGNNPNVKFCSEAMETLQGADALLVVTEWTEFKSPDFEKMKSMLKTPLIFDGRNIYTPKEVKEYGFEYYGIGRLN